MNWNKSLKRYSPEEKEQAKQAFLKGETPEEIAKWLGCSARIVRVWAKKMNWYDQLNKRRKIGDNLESQIALLLSKEDTSYSNAKRIAMLTNALKRLRSIAPPPNKSQKPIVKQTMSAELLERMLAPDYGLYSYQKAFLKSEARFVKVLKARQTGYSYGCLAPKALLRAVAGRNQLIVSASEYQSRIVLGYIQTHMERLEIFADEITDKGLVINGTSITALPANFRTIQGNPGDVILDEFAWLHRQKRVWSAIVPSITQVGGTVTVCSTPFVPGNLFWEIITEHKGKYTNFESHKLTIHDAIEQGMPIPGGLEELRSLFDSESWAMLYECQWAEDGSSLLSWDLLHDLASATETRFWDAPIYVGVDVGRTNDRFAVACVGKEEDGFRLLHLELHKSLSFAKQRQVLESLFERYHVKRMGIDRTGLGMQLSEEVVNAHPGVAVGRYFSRGFKERLALNLLKLCEDKRLVLYNDPVLLTQLHAVKKKATATGISYDADRDETGHADGFWALALAVEGLSRSLEKSVVIEVW
jgi:phage FluMu gp28-like protein/transposase-like protein